MSGYVWHNGDWVPKAKYYAQRPVKHASFPMVIHDRTEYKSIYNDQWITSRSHHREHLKAHNLQEVGDEKPGWMQERDRMRSEGLTQGQIEAEERRSPPPDEGVTFQWEDIDG